MSFLKKTATLKCSDFIDNINAEYDYQNNIPTSKLHEM